MNRHTSARKSLIQELEMQCHTIAISLDNWTSRNNKPIIGIIGYWLNLEFKRQCQVLEFQEIQGRFIVC